MGKQIPKLLIIFFLSSWLLPVYSMDSTQKNTLDTVPTGYLLGVGQQRWNCTFFSCPSADYQVTTSICPNKDGVLLIGVHSSDTSGSVKGFYNDIQLVEKPDGYHLVGNPRVFNTAGFGWVEFTWQIWCKTISVGY